MYACVWRSSTSSSAAATRFEDVFSFCTLSHYLQGTNLLHFGGLKVSTLEVCESFLFGNDGYFKVTTTTTS
jgi:hypothetical protein